METVYYYFDESGEKGFIKDGFSKTDIGLIAGIAMPQRCISEFETNVATILSKLETSDVEKIHSAELFKKEENRKVRDELLEYMASKEEWLLVYEAVYPLGLYNNEMTSQESILKNRPKNPRVSVSNNITKTRIYNSLLEGIIIKLDEICKIESSSNLIMVSDHIDSGIHKEALGVLGYLKQSEHQNTVTGYDTVDKKLVSKEIFTKIVGVEVSVKNVETIKVDSSESPMTIAADIVANTLYRHFNHELSTKPGLRLHGDEIISGYILKDKVAFIGNTYVMDDLYSPS